MNESAGDLELRLAVCRQYVGQGLTLTSFLVTGITRRGAAKTALHLLLLHLKNLGAFFISVLKAGFGLLNLGPW